MWKRKTIYKNKLPLKTNESDRRTRLIDLGSEVLSDVLLELAAHNEVVDDTIERLVAVPQTNIERFKDKLSSLKFRDRFIDWREIDSYAHEVESLLRDLRAGVTDARMGVELVVAFYESEEDIFDNCDDSVGVIGNLFQYDARELFAYFAARCEDKRWLCDILLGLYAEDRYGVRDTLFDNAIEYLPEKDTRALIERLWELVSEESENFKKRPWLDAIESLAQQLRDASLFERARRTREDNMSGQSLVDIAQVYFDSGNAAEALSWLKQLSPSKQPASDSQDTLLLKIYEKLNNHEASADIAWRMFRQDRTIDSLTTLIAVIGEDRRSTTIDNEAKEILKSDNLSYSDARFLIDTEHLDEAEIYLLQRVKQIDGDLYGSILPLAEAMENNQRLLAATVLYRALLDSILGRANSKAYYHGVEYLCKMDKMASLIINWANFIPHDVYVQSLHQSHSRKRSFWSQYG